MYEDHKSFIPGVGMLVTSWDGSESNFISLEDMNWHNEQDHHVVTVYEDEDKGKVAYWMHLKPGEDVAEKTAGLTKPFDVEWVTIKTLEKAS